MPARASQRVSCIVLAMLSTLREAMQAELKGCGLNEAVVPSKISCELAFTMPSARSEAMQVEFKGCGLAYQGEFLHGSATRAGHSKRELTRNL